MRKSLPIRSLSGASRALFASVLMLGSAFGASAAVFHVKPTSTEPAANSEIPSCVGVDEIKVTIPGGGELGLKQIIRANKNIEISRDGSPYLTISVADPAAVTFSPTSINEIVIHCGHIDEPGTYSVSIPSDIVEINTDSSTVGDSGDEEEQNYYYNSAYSFSFGLVAMPDYSISPAPGLYKPSDIATFTVSFPEGSELTVSSSSTFALYTYDLYTGTSSRVTTYTPSAQGNKLVLTADNPSAIKGLTQSKSREWDYISMPKDAVTILLDGQTYRNPYIKFEKYDVREVGAAGYAISPSPAEDLLPADVKEFVLSYPASATLGTSAKVGQVGAYLRQTGNSEEAKNAYTGFLFGSLVITAIDTQAHTITMVMKDPVSDLEYENNTSMMETGYYCVSLMPRIIAGVSSLNFPGYGVKGKDGCPLSGVRVMVAGEAREELTLARGESFNGVELFFPFKMTVADGSKAITVTRDGQLQASVAVRTLSIPAAGDNYAKVMFGRSCSVPGTYKVNIPGGAFAQKLYGDYLNLDQTVNIVIPGATTGVDAVEADEAESVWYTLDGRIVKAGGLAPGIYVRVRGTKAEKILVK